MKDEPTITEGPVSGRYLITEPMPAWFEIGFSNNVFTIDVHPDVHTELLHRITQIAIGISDIADQVNDLGPFFPPIMKQWGFGSVIHTVDGPAGWRRYRCALPKIHSYANNTSQTSFRESHAVCLTLSVIFEALEFMPQVPAHDRMQLCCPRLFTAGPNSWPMRVDLSPEFIEWIKGRIAWENFLQPPAPQEGIVFMGCGLTAQT